MKKHFLEIGLTSLALINGAFADDLSTYRLDDVVVTATRTPQSLRASLGDVSVIAEEQIRLAGQSTLVELLQSQPGVDVYSNGGMGTTSFVQLRGADKSHTLVLVDGMRINSATMGTTAFENIPLSQIERIEILRGPASHLYGSEAIGGVIQIFTKSGKGEPKPNFSAGFGSYNTRTLSGGFSGEANDTRFSLQAGQVESDGISAFSDGNGGYKNKNQDNDAYRNSNLTAKLAHSLGYGNEVGVNVFSSYGRNHYDSGTSATSTKVDYFRDQTLSSFDLYSKNRLASDWQSILRIGTGADHSNDYSSTKSVTNTDQNQFTWQNDITVGTGLAMLGVERLEQKVSGTANFTVKARTIQSYFAGYQMQAGNHSVQMNVRQDDNSQFGLHETGFLGYGYQITPRWRVSASASTAFKAPTFNNLYAIGGNPDLRPEKARNKEIALHYDQGVHHFSAVYYDNQVTDLISYPAPTYVVSQIQQASLTGATLSYQGGFGDYRLRANLDAQDPVDRISDNLLKYRARQHASVALNRRVGEWELGGEWRVSSYRYNDDANTQRMGGYSLVNLTVSRSLGGDWSMQGRVNNLFDKQYELAQGYGTPGINLFVGVQYQPAK